MAILNRADQARDSKQYETAIPLFGSAFEKFKQIQDSFPTWQPQRTRFRMNYAQDQMQRLLRSGGWISPKTESPGENTPSAPSPVVSENSPRGARPAAQLDSLTSEARHLLAEGDPKGARVMLMEALMEAPDNATLRLLTATAQCMDGEYMDALLILDQLAADFPGNTDIQLLRGAAYTGIGDLKEAQDQLQQALTINPNLAEAHFNLVGLFLAQSPPDNDLALAHYEKAITLGGERDAGIEIRVGYDDEMSDDPPEDAEPEELGNQRP